MIHEEPFAFGDSLLHRIDPRIRVVGIAGPGDPLATPDTTLDTLRRVREKYPDMLLCLATNGLNLPSYADEIAQLDVSHVTVTVNAVLPEIGARIYSWVRDEERRRPLRGAAASEFLLEKQLEGIARLKANGVTVKINTILIPGVNDEHIAEVARVVSELGADLFNCIPLYPVLGSEWGRMPTPPEPVVARVRAEAGLYMKQMHHCTRCRADAVGLLGEEVTDAKIALLTEIAAAPFDPAENRPYVAVGSMEGVLVNQHLGESTHLWIFSQNDEKFRLVDTRSTPEPGQGAKRWEELALRLKDCRALLVSGVGESPRTILSSRGIRVIEMEGLIEPALRSVYEGREICAPIRIRKTCGDDCAGNGMGCG